MIYLTCATWLLQVSHEWGNTPDIMKDWVDLHWNGETWYYAPQDFWYRPEPEISSEPLPF